MDNVLEKFKEHSGPVIEQKARMPEMIYKIPTEFVDLPSKGEGYPEGHPFKGKDKVEIKYMTTREEDILMSPSFLRENLTTSRLVDSLLAMEVAETLRMCDIKAIILQAFRTNYINKLTFNPECIECGHKNELEIDLNKQEFVRKPFDGALDFNGILCSFVLPSGATVEIKPLYLHDYKDISKNSERFMTDLIKKLLVSINGCNDPEKVSKVELLKKDAKYILDVFSHLEPKIDIDTTFQCKNSKCNLVQKGGVVSVDTTMFWLFGDIAK